MSCKCKNCGYEVEKKPKKCPKCGNEIWMEMSSKIDEIYGRKSKDEKRE